MSWAINSELAAIIGSVCHIFPSSYGIILSSSTNSSFIPNITKATSGGLDSSDVHVIYPQSLPTVTIKDDGKFAICATPRYLRIFFANCYKW